ncbi:MAG TPA: hypothetical protein VF193_12950 [Steroidobacter sp.]
MSRTCTAISSAVTAALLLLGGSSLAMEPQEEAAASEPQASEGSELYETLQRVTHYRNFRGLKIPTKVIGQLAQAQADAAVAALSAAAERGDADANIALVRVQHWCSSMMSSRAADPNAQLEKLRNQLPEDRLQRLVTVLRAEAEFRNRARSSCAQARFDYRGIEARLRSAADSGHAASATELAQFVRDPAQKQALLEAAVEKNYPPALYAKATNLLVAVQRGQTTENVSAIRELLKQAGRSIPKAKLDFANCVAVGCDGHPADALTARAFGIDAARDGEPTAFLSMARMPWGAHLPREELLAWQYFGDRLNEAGCMGDSYLASSIAFAQTIGLLERAQDPEGLEEARKQAEQLWKQYGQRAMRENGCIGQPDNN